MSSPTEPQSARDRFIEVLRSRSMMRPSEEWVIDANWQLLQFAEQEDRHLVTASASTSVQGIRDAAKQITDQTAD